MEQTRRETVYFVKACVDQRGAPGPPKGAADLLLSVQRATGLALAKEMVPAAQADDTCPGHPARPPGHLPAAHRDQRGFKTTNKQTKNEMLLSPSAYLGSEKKNIFVLFCFIVKATNLENNFGDFFFFFPGLCFPFFLVCVFFKQ